MGVKKVKTKKVKSGGVLKKAAGMVTSSLGAIKGTKARGFKRSRRATPEKLAKQILILKLKKKLWKMKYGGR